MALLSPLNTRSTFRPPPFISVSKGTGYAMPTHPVLPSHHTPAPTLGDDTSPHHHHHHHYNDTASPQHTTAAPFTSAFTTDNDSLALTMVDGEEWKGVSQEGPHWWWNLTDVNLTTTGTLSGVTSEMMMMMTTGQPDPHYPAGYPSGYTWPHIIMASIILTAVMLIIVVGNFLVMWAIVRDKNLKGTQNYFIGSLALADFLLGLLIVPFSLANELMGYWYFGTIFCEMWKAVDVLLCTASITSLCLISLDRYWSITKAIHYSRQRTPKRAAVMIFIVWFVSAAICIPPLIGWNQPAPDSDWPVCALSEDIGYVLYSSMGSFYIPAFIMVFVYFKIYQAAKARARKNVSKAPRGGHSEVKSEQKSTESSGGGGTEHPNQDQGGQLEASQFSLDYTMEPTMTTTLTTGVTAAAAASSSTTPLPLHELRLLEDGFDSPLKTRPLMSPCADEMEQAGMLSMSDCRCVNDMAEEDGTATPGPTSDDDDDDDDDEDDDDEEEGRGGGGSHGQEVVDFRSRSVSLPCRALRHDELTKLISTDSDSCDALAGPVLNLMDRRGRLALSMPTTTTTDTDSSLDLSHLQLQQHCPHPPHHHQIPHLTLPACSAASLKTLTPPLSEATTPVNSPVLLLTETTGVAAPPQDNGAAIQQFRIVEPKQNGNVDKSPSSSNGQSPGGRAKKGLFGSLRRQLFQPNNGRVGEKQAKALPKKKEHKKVAVAREDKNDLFSAERHKRKLAKARERRATLVLGLVMAAFILCWLPFFLLYVVSAFCEGCIPMMVFTIFFWIGYCNSALNPLIYTVFNRDFRRAFHRIIFGRRRGRR